eukprot:336890-Prymnesium_polylepis.1
MRVVPAASTRRSLGSELENLPVVLALINRPELALLILRVARLRLVGHTRQPRQLQLRPALGALAGGATQRYLANAEVRIGAGVVVRPQPVEVALWEGGLVVRERLDAGGRVDAVDVLLNPRLSVPLRPHPRRLDARLALRRLQVPDALSGRAGVLELAVRILDLGSVVHTLRPLLRLRRHVEPHLARAVILVAARLAVRPPLAVPRRLDLPVDRMVGLGGEHTHAVQRLAAT